MHDRDAHESHTRGAGAHAAPVALHASQPTPTLPEDVERAVWGKTLAGLSALTHANCWIAASVLVELYSSYVGPYLRASTPDFVMLRVVAQATSRVNARVERDPLFDQKNKPWPKSAAEAHDWLVALIEAYQETIRIFWANGKAHDNPDSAAYQLSRQCFAQVEASEQQAHATDLYRDVASWQPCSVVLPAYNEAENIGDTMSQCVEALTRICPNFEVIVVNDGSRDATGAIAAAEADKDASIVAVHNNPNKGYGGALLAGFAAARGERVFFMDSDGQFDIREIATLLGIVESGQSPIAIGYRAKRSDPFMRKLNAWGWKQAAKRVVGLRGIRDIDCAFKLFPLDALRSCQLIAKGASVNVEMLLKFGRMGLQVTQVPVKHMPRTKGSPTGAKLHVILRAFRELFHLRRHMQTWQPRYPVRSGQAAVGHERMQRSS